MESHLPTGNRYSDILRARTLVKPATGTNRSLSEASSIRSLSEASSIRSLSEASSIRTPMTSSTEKPKPQAAPHTEGTEPTEPPAKSMPQNMPNPFDSIWALAKQYKEYCSLELQGPNSTGSAFTDCPVLDNLWDCCRAICEIKVDTGSVGRLPSTGETWSELMVLVTELCMVLYPRVEASCYFTTEAHPSSFTNVSLTTLRMAIGQLVDYQVPEATSGLGYNEVCERFQLVNQLWKLSEYEKEPNNCRSCYIHLCGGVDLSEKYDSIIDALWLLLEAAFSALGAQDNEAVRKECGEFEPEVHLKIRSRYEREAYNACWKLCEALNAALVSSVWSKDSEFEIYSQLYSPRKKSINPSSTESSQDSQRHESCESVSGWNRGITTTQKELDQAGVVDGDYSDNESTQTSSEASGEKGGPNLAVLPADARKPVLNQDTWTVTAEAATSSMANVRCPEGAPKSWDEDISAQANVRSVSPETQIPKKTEQPQPPSSLSPKLAPPVAPVATSTSASSPPQPKPPSSCARCSGIDTSDIEAIHHIRLRILILRAAIAKGYCPYGNRKFGDFVRDMPGNAFGDTKAQKKLLKSYRRAILYFTDNIKAKGDTVAHEANLMQMKAAVEWKTQGGSYRFLKDLYKLVVGVEVEKVDTLSEKLKATIITG